MSPHRLDRYRTESDMPSVDPDGSHTTALRGCEWSDTLRNQKQETTNALYLTDRQELLLVMYPPRHQENTVIYTTLKGSSHYVQRPWKSRHQDGIRPI